MTGYDGSGLLLRLAVLLEPCVTTSVKVTQCDLIRHVVAQCVLCVNNVGTPFRQKGGECGSRRFRNIYIAAKTMHYTSEFAIFISPQKVTCCMSTIQV